MIRSKGFHPNLNKKNLWTVHNLEQLECWKSPMKERKGMWGPLGFFRLWPNKDRDWWMCSCFVWLRQSLFYICKVGISNDPLILTQYILSNTSYSKRVSCSMVIQLPLPLLWELLASVRHKMHNQGYKTPTKNPFEINDLIVIKLGLNQGLFNPRFCNLCLSPREQVLTCLEEWTYDLWLSEN